MSNQKPVYLLAGGRGRGGKTTDSIIQTVFRDIGKPSPTIAYVGAASEDNEDFFKFIGTMIKKAGDSEIIHALIYPENADLKKAQDILKAADAVFMSGGDVERGMQVLEEKNMICLLQDLFKQGKLFFGISAGSIMLAKEWVRWSDPDDGSTAELFPCLGLVPVICDTHGEADGWEELKTLLKLKEDNVKGYGITTETCLKVFLDGKVEALGGAIYQYIRHRGKVERQHDVLPINP